MYDKNSLLLTLPILPFENISAARNNGLILGAMGECMIYRAVSTQYSDHGSVGALMF